MKCFPFIWLLLSATTFGQGGMADFDPIQNAVEELALTHEKLFVEPFAFCAKGIWVHERFGKITVQDHVIIHYRENETNEFLASAFVPRDTPYWIMKMVHNGKIGYTTGSPGSFDSKKIDEKTKYRVVLFDPILQSVSNGTGFLCSNTLPSPYLLRSFQKRFMEKVKIDKDYDVTYTHTQKRGDVSRVSLSFAASNQHRPVTMNREIESKGKVMPLSRVDTTWSDFQGRYLPSNMSVIHYPVTEHSGRYQLECEIDWRFKKWDLDLDGDWLAMIQKEFGVLFPSTENE